jgi:hypothetical protein
MFPKFMNTETKRAMIDSFIWLCKLTDIMRDIAVFHESNRFDREWSDSRMDGTSIMPELTKVSEFDSRLRNWEEGFRKINGDFIKSPVAGRCKMPNYVLIMNKYVLSRLWLPPPLLNFHQFCACFFVLGVYPLPCGQYPACTKVSEGGPAEDQSSFICHSPSRA